MVARALLGQWLCHGAPDGLRLGRIVEVEAYGGEDDPASHAARGPTRRTRPMYGAPGHAYVYLAYGLHRCANVVTEPAGRAAAVLIRAVEVAASADGARPRGDGPGRVCRALGVELCHDSADLCRAGPGRLWLAPGEPVPDRHVLGGPRVGVRDPRPWRLADAGSPAVSRPRPPDRPQPRHRLGAGPSAETKAGRHRGRPAS